MPLPEPQRAWNSNFRIEAARATQRCPSRLVAIQVSSTSCSDVSESTAMTLRCEPPYSLDAGTRGRNETEVEIARVFDQHSRDRTSTPVAARLIDRTQPFRHRRSPVPDRSSCVAITSSRLRLTAMALSASMALCGCATVGEAVGTGLEKLGLKQPTSIAEVKAMVPLSKEVTFRLHAGEALNVDAESRPLSVVVRVYRLKSTEAFMNAPLTAFKDAESEKAAFGPEVIERPGSGADTQTEVRSDRSAAVGREVHRRCRTVSCTKPRALAFCVRERCSRQVGVDTWCACLRVERRDWACT